MSPTWELDVPIQSILGGYPWKSHNGPQPATCLCDGDDASHISSTQYAGANVQMSISYNALRKGTNVFDLCLIRPEDWKFETLVALIEAIARSSKIAVL